MQYIIIAENGKTWESDFGAKEFKYLCSNILINRSDNNGAKPRPKNKFKCDQILLIQKCQVDQSSLYTQQCDREHVIIERWMQLCKIHWTVSGIEQKKNEFSTILIVRNFKTSSNKPAINPSNWRASSINCWWINNTNIEKKARLPPRTSSI